MKTMKSRKSSYSIGKTQNPRFSSTTTIAITALAVAQRRSLEKSTPDLFARGKTAQAHLIQEVASLGRLSILVILGKILPTPSSVGRYKMQKKF
jgi:hypothetical protein